MLDFGVPPSPRLSLHWQHREGWGQCTCTSSSCRPSGLVWLWHHSGENRQNISYTSAARAPQNPTNQILFLRHTTRFLLQVSDAAGELGWQLERVGLLGDKVGLAMRGDSGSPFSSVDLGWQLGKAPGLREPPVTTGTLQEKQRKRCNELNPSKDKGAQTKARLALCKQRLKVINNFEK